MADEVVIGATRKDFVLTVLDANFNAVNVTGSSFALQGVSADLPAHQINVGGTVTDGPLGLVTWSGVGGTAYIQSADLGSLTQAIYTFRVKWTDNASKVDYSPSFQWAYVPAPM